MIIIAPIHWKLNCLVFTLGEYYYLISLVYKCKTIPFSLYAAFLFSTFYFYVASYILYAKLATLYKIILKNDRLLREMIKVLEIFPHGVIISPKDSGEVKESFINNEFEQQIRNLNNRIELLKDIDIEYVNNESGSGSQPFTTNLFDFLKEQENRVSNAANAESSKVIINCMEEQYFNQLFESENQHVIKKNFNIKSVEVDWNGNPSFMHVFIDMTDIMKLEQAQSNIKLQKIMFASVSHEFRTPLNSIINSFSILKHRYEKFIS